MDFDGYTALPPGKIAAVVTYLEMTEPPDPLPVQDPEIVRWNRPDPDEYLEIFRAVGAPWLWWGRLAMARAELADLLSNPHHDVFTLQAPGGRAGLLEIDRRNPADVELSYFGLPPEFIGRGHGRRMMDFAITHVWQQRPARFWLHTCTLDHPAALDFYVRSGFRPYRRAVEIADDPRLSGLLPETAAPHVPIIGGNSRYTTEVDASPDRRAAKLQVSPTNQ